MVKKHSFRVFSVEYSGVDGSTNDFRVMNQIYAFSNRTLDLFIDCLINRVEWSI